MKNFNLNAQTMNYTYTDYEGQTIESNWHEDFTRNFVISFMHYNGSRTNFLSNKHYESCYLLADGFGSGLSLSFCKEQSFDWSHVRDSSDEAFKNMADYLLNAKIITFMVGNNSEWANFSHYALTQVRDIKSNIPESEWSGIFESLIN